MKFWLGSLVWIVAACRVATPTSAPSIQDQLGRLEAQALAARDAGNHEEAIAIVRHMAALAPDHPWPYELAVRLHNFSGDFDEAEILLRSLSTDGPGITYGLAHLEYYREHREAARTGYAKALEEYVARGDVAGQAFCHKALGSCSLPEAPLEPAEESLSAARQLFNQLGDEAWEANVVDQVAVIKRMRSRFEEALDLHREALSIRQRIHDLRGEGSSWSLMGFTLREAGDLEGALDAFRKAADRQREVGDARTLYQVLKQVARTYEKLKREGLAIEALLEAATILDEIGGVPDRVCDTRMLAARFLSRIGRNNEAIEQLDLARRAAEEAGAPESVAAVEELTSVVLIYSGRYGAATVSARAAIDLASTNDLPEIEANALTSLSQTSLFIGDLSTALLAQRQALELYEKKESLGNQLNARINLGAIHRQLGDSASAEHQFQMGLQIAQENTRRRKNSPAALEHEARAHNAIGAILKDEDRLEEALAHQTESLRLLESLDEMLKAAWVRSNLADLLWALDRRREALELVAQALVIFRERDEASGEADALNLKGRFLLEQGRLDEALGVCTAAVGLARERGLRPDERTGHALRARALEAAGKPEEALAEYDRAVELIESQRAGLPTDGLKARFFAPASEVYDRAASLRTTLEMSGDPAAPQGFLRVEQARARSLADLLAESATFFRQRLSPTLAARELELIDRQSAAAVRLTDSTTPAQRVEAEDELAEAEASLVRFKAELSLAEPAYAQVVYPSPIGLRDVQQQLLGEGETLLRFFFGAGRALLWVVDRHEARVLDLGPPEAIQALVDEFLSRAGASGSGLGERPESDAQAAELGRRLQIPSSRGGGRLLIVPDGPLLRLPFEALRIDGRYLIEDREVVLAPSATVLRLLSRPGRGHAAGGFLGAGDPIGDADGSRFPRLSHSGAALERIAGMFPERGRVVLSREHCTKEELRRQALESFRFVHFATHGWLDPDRPRRVGLRFSPAPGTQVAELLSVDDVFPLQLSAELVVLAACQSGLGEMLPGEGLQGLARAFLYAGARSVVVTLWDVSDKAAAEFMETFYRELDGRTIPEALRRTKLAFIKSDRPALRQPFRWAPFVLVGVPGTAPVRLNPEPIVAKTLRAGS